MPESKREQRGHFRGKARPGRRVAVRWRVATANAGSTDAVLSGFTKNIGVGGAFILTTEPLAPGTQLQVTIVLSPSDKPIDVTAEVRWVIDDSHQSDKNEQGMGIRFAPLDVDSLVLLTEYFAQLTSTLDLGEA